MGYYTEDEFFEEYTRHMNIIIDCITMFILGLHEPAKRFKIHDARKSAIINYVVLCAPGRVTSVKSKVSPFFTIIIPTSCEVSTGLSQISFILRVI